MANRSETKSKSIKGILIGESGAGKSTLINYLYNLCRDGSPQNLIVGVPTRFHKVNIDVKHDERSELDTTTSKTVTCSSHVFDYGNHIFEIIDTPGINCTSGLDVDNENVEQIFDCIRNVDTLNFIILVLNGTCSRVTLGVQHVIRSFMEKIPTEFGEHFLVVLTNCKEYRTNFDIESSGLPVKDKSNLFYMQNSVFSQDIRELAPEYQVDLLKDWIDSMHVLKSLVTRKLMHMTPLSISLFDNIDEEQNKLNSLIDQISSRLEQMGKYEMELDVKQSETSSYLKDQRKNLELINDLKEHGIETLETVHSNIICNSCWLVCQDNSAEQNSTNTENDTNILWELLQRNTHVCSVCECGGNDHLRDSKIKRLASVEDSVKLGELQEELRNIRRKLRDSQQAVTESKICIGRLDSEIEVLMQDIQKINNDLKNATIKRNTTTDLNNYLSLISKVGSISKSSTFTERIDRIKQRLQNIFQETRRTNPKCNKKASNDKHDPAYTHQWSNEDLLEYYSSHRNTYYYGYGYRYGYERDQHKKVKHELLNRLRGESFGFLLNQQLLEFGDLFVTHNSKGQQELNEAANRLNEEIRAKTRGYNVNYFREVSKDKLLELAVLKLLLSRDK